MVYLNSHVYSSISKEVHETNEIIPRPIERKWYRRGIRISVPVFILAISIQVLLFTTTVASILRARKFIVLPIDTHLRDPDDNYCELQTHRNPDICANTPVDPAAAAVKYETRIFQYNKTFLTLAGSPTQQTDDAWREMQAPTDGTIQASYRTGFELDSLVKTVPSKEYPEQYIYGLEVYHQLHCLDYIRQSFYPQIYFPNDTEYEVVHHRGIHLPRRREQC